MRLPGSPEASWDWRPSNDGGFAKWIAARGRMRSQVRSISAYRREQNETIEFE
jgi:hypothetical protein